MEKRAYAFVFAGFFITDKEPLEVFRQDVSAEDMEEIEKLVKEKLFKPGVDVALAPSIVPPNQADTLLHEFGNVIFSNGDSDA